MVYSFMRICIQAWTNVIEEGGPCLWTRPVLISPPLLFPSRPFKSCVSYFTRISHSVLCLDSLDRRGWADWSALFLAIVARHGGLHRMACALGLKRDGDDLEMVAGVQ